MQLSTNVVGGAATKAGSSVNGRHVTQVMPWRGKLSGVGATATGLLFHLLA
jgi:hypothetical protein